MMRRSTDLNEVLSIRAQECHPYRPMVEYWTTSMKS